MRTYHAVKFLSKREKLKREEYVRTEVVKSGLNSYYKWKCEKCSELFKRRKDLHDHKGETHGY